MSYLPPTFELSVEEVDEQTAVVSVRGEIHLATAPEFSERLNDVIAEGRTAVVVDLTEVGFIDSTGLSVLLNALRRITRAAGLDLGVHEPDRAAAVRGHEDGHDVHHRGFARRGPGASAGMRVGRPRRRPPPR